MADEAKRIVYVDMDGVLVDFASGLERVPAEIRDKYRGHEDDIPGIFALMGPMAGAVDVGQGDKGGCCRRAGRPPATS